jgi:hypothetical protein
LNVGVSDIIPAAFFTADFFSNNFDVHYAPGKLKIKPARLTIKADDKVIFAGDPVPPFTSTITGFKYRDSVGNVISSGPLYRPTTYTNKAGSYPIQPYGVVQKQTPPNYDTIYVAGTLYVNPKGGNAKNVKPSLDCVEPLTNDPDGYTFVAHYSANNPNATAVFVALGDSNKVVPNNGFAPQPPTVFPPGTITWNMKFNGAGHVWSLTTFNGNQQTTATTSNASSTSGRCPGSTTRRASDVQESPTGFNKMGVYPNPTRSKATLFIGTAEISLKDIRIVDIAGKVYPVSLRSSSTQTVELDLGPLDTGIYFVKVLIAGQTKLFKVEKM